MSLARVSSLVLALVSLNWIASPLAVAGPLKAGAATSNITPELGGGIIGGFLPIPSKHVHDELHARCLVLDDGSTQVAIVVCDLLGLHRGVSDEARKLIAERLGIPRDNVMISGTHTHSAISALGSNRFQHEQPLDDYQQFVASRIADGVQRARNNLQPAEIAFGTVDIPEHVFNRRWYMKTGTVPPNPFGGTDIVKMNPPGGSPNLIEPAGPTDPTVSFVAVREPNGRPLSVFAAYSLHYVGDVGPGHISADYFAVFCKELARALEPVPQDPPFVALLANGTSGDINNINFREPRPRTPPYTRINAVGQDVAAKVAAAMTGLTWKSDVTLGARYREPEIGMRRPTDAELAAAKKLIAERPPNPEKADLPVIYAERTLKMAENPATSPIPIQILKLGDVCVGSMPCEIFCEIGLEFKDRCPIKPAFMISLNHGYYGYLPPPRQHKLGGYETWMGTNRLEVTASEKLLDQLVEMAAELNQP